MRVIEYHSNKDLRLKDIPIPVIGDGEILVKVISSGVCGTDTMEWYRIKKAPRILGHEITGEIVESKTDKYKIGQRVFVSHHVSCNECKYCLMGNHSACETLHKGNYDPGGYSEFVRVPLPNVKTGTYVLPDTVSYDAGTLIEPLACVVRCQNTIHLQKGHTVLIPGCGVSGLLNIQLAKQKGAKVIATDINDHRLELAKSFGADEVFNAKDDFNVKADRVILCTEAYSAATKAFESIDKKGVILFFAIPSKNVELSMADFWRNELTVTSSYGAASYDLEEALKLIADKKIIVENLITHRLGLEEIQNAFDIALSAKDSLKIVLKPSGK